MKCYLVGGAVRNKVLNIPVDERDWVVVGQTPEALLKKGYKAVGKSFPVFIHPQTKEEYALARKEVKSGKGYKGFNVDFNPNITLEEDLKRRDLTINAMALTEDETIVDPYGGLQDCEKRQLTHVSDAFLEDPLRVLRVARFAAKLPEFSVSQKTAELMRGMVSSGELHELIAERVWKEVSRALVETAPWRFFEVLADCGAIVDLWPALPPEEILIKRLKHACSLSDKAEVRFACLFQGIEASTAKQVCTRMSSPSEFKQLAVLVSRFAGHCQIFQTISAAEKVDILRSTDAFRKPERFKQFLCACESAMEIDQVYDLSKGWLDSLAIARQVDIAKLMQTGLSGEKLGNAIHQARVILVQKASNKS